jgi:hypothetical protein
LALPQILAGTAWCKAAGGFSFTNLRTMMVLHGVVPVWLLWLFLRQLKVARGPAMLAVLLFCVNPITVSLTWSFQTDLVYLSFVLAASIVTLWADREPEPLDSAVRGSPDPAPGATDRSPESGRPAVGGFGEVGRPAPNASAPQNRGRTFGLVLAAAALLLLAFLTRQSAIFVTAAVAAYWGLRRRWLWLACTLAVVPLMLVLEKWLIWQSELTYLPWVKGHLSRSLGDWSLGRLAYCAYETLHVVIFLGLLLLPLLVVAQKKLTPSRWALTLAAFVLVVGVFFLDVPAHRTALLGNYIYAGQRCGIGPATLELSSGNPAGVAQGGERPMLMSIIALAALVGGGLMLVKLGDVAASFVRAIRHWSGGPQFLAEAAFCATLAGTLVASVLIGRTAFDRYVWLLCPLVMPLCLRPEPPLRRLLAICVPVALLLAIVSYAGVVDYWRWNQARWQALAWLESQGVAPERIDGGYEFNAIHNLLAMPAEMMTEQDRQRQAAIVAARRGRKVYCLRFAPRTGERVAARVPYQTPLLAGTQDIFVVRGRDQLEIGKAVPRPPNGEP